MLQQCLPGVQLYKPALKVVSYCINQTIAHQHLPEVKKKIQWTAQLTMPTIHHTQDFNTVWEEVTKVQCTALGWWNYQTVG